MTAIVLDCSVIVAIAFKDELDDFSRRAFDVARRDGALVPQLWPFEVANALNLGIKRSRLTLPEAEGFLSKLAKVPIKVARNRDANIAATVRELFSLARQHELTAYDAEYLRLALASGLPLASKDADLNAAAREAGARLFV